MQTDQRTDQAEPRATLAEPIPTQLEADGFKNMAHGDTPPAGAPVNIDVPYVSGQGTVGQTLDSTVGNWTGEPTDYSGEWFSDGATPLGMGSEYLIQASDVGHAITCVVTATNAFGSTVAPPSNAITVT